MTEQERAAFEAMEAVLREYEFCIPDAREHARTCPACWYTRENGHSASCLYATALALAAAAKPKETP